MPSTVVAEQKPGSRRPGWFERVCQPPPHVPRPKKSAATPAQANAEAHGQNGRLQASALPTKPSSGHSVAIRPGGAPGGPPQTQRSGGAGGQRGVEKDRPPPAFGLVGPPKRHVEKTGAPYPVSSYGQIPDPEPHPTSFGLLRPAPVPAPSMRTHATAGLARTPPHDFDPQGNPGTGLDYHQPYHQSYPPTPPEQKRQDRSVPGRTNAEHSLAAAHNTSAYLSNGAVGTLYSPLGASEIRLIRIPPAQPGPLRCAFVHTFLDQPLPYVALSYSWGSTSNKIPIELDGHITHVTANLYEALRMLQTSNRDVFCWADAICINQSDKAEVSQQVQMMGSVYSIADSVAVWLGPGSRDSDEAIKLIVLLAELDSARNDAMVRRLIESPQRRSGFTAIVSLFEREYWRRLWVVQEVLNAKEVTVHCGALSLSWDKLECVADIFRRNSHHIDGHFAAMSGDDREALYVSQRNRFSYARVLAELGPSSFKDTQLLLGLGTTTDKAFKATKFLRTLQSCRNRFATDPRDKVYGVLGVAPDDAQKAIAPDYTLSTREVYTKAAEYIITASGRLDVVCHALHYPIHVTALGLPTWVPDWSHVSPMMVVDWPTGMFRAGGDMHEEATITDHSVLNMQAIFIDRVKSRGSPVGTTNTAHDMAMSFLHWFALLQARFKTSSKSQLERVEMEFCRLLVFDKMHPLFARDDVWREVTLHLFASLVADILPEMPLHPRLVPYSQPGAVDLGGVDRNTLLEETFVSSMTGRSFFITNSGHIGMGSGYLAIGDSVVVPLGCTTPLILRKEGDLGEHRLVSDAFVGGYMYGRAVEEWKSGAVQASRYRIH